MAIRRLTPVTAMYFFLSPPIHSQRNTPGNPSFSQPVTSGRVGYDSPYVPDATANVAGPRRYVYREGRPGFGVRKRTFCCAARFPAACPSLRSGTYGGSGGIYSHRRSPFSCRIALSDNPRRSQAHHRISETDQETAHHRVSSVLRECHPEPVGAILYSPTVNGWFFNTP